MPGELIRRDCIVDHVPVTQHRYVARGWGVGEVWLDGDLLLLHELAGTVPGLRPPVRAPRRGAALQPGHGQREGGGETPLPPEGGARAPTGTLAAESSREGDGFVSDLCRRFEEHLGGRPTSYEHVHVD